jgi:hypothetical protein
MRDFARGYGRVFDLFLALLLARAAFVTARGRSFAGLSASLGALTLSASLVAAGWYARLFDGTDRWGLAVFMFFGPSAMPGPTDRFAGGVLIGTHPFVTRVVLTGLLGGAFALAARHVNRVSPLSDEAERRKDVALALLAPLVLAVLQLGFVAIAAEAASSV